MRKNVLLSTALKVALGVAIATTLPLQLSHAASNDGSLVGKVITTDESALKGLEITVRNPETGFVRTVKADDSGHYRFPFLPVGKYVIEGYYGVALTSVEANNDSSRNFRRAAGRWPDPSKASHRWIMSATQ